MFRLLCSAALALGLLVALPTAANAAPGCRPLDAATRSAIDAIAKAAAAGPNGQPGLALVVETPRGCYSQSYGVRDVRTREPMQAADHVRIASITKTFTATVILHTVDKGMLRLDDKLDRYIKGVPNGEKITLRQVLGMSAGIYDYTSDEKFTADLDADPLLRFSTADFFAILHRHQPAYEPGAQTVYSDSNYYLLTLLAEKVTGRPFADLVQSWVLDPLTLRGSSYPNTPDLPQPFARGYLPGDPIKDVTRVRPDISLGAGAMISTVEDQAVWARVLMKGTLLSRPTQAERLKIHPLDGVTGPLKVGYGLGILDLQGYLGHNGAILGYSAAAFYRPDIDTTIAVVGNRSTNFSTPATDVFVAIAKKLDPELFPKA